VSTDVLEALDGILACGGEPDDVLRQTVALLVANSDITWAGIAFVDEGGLVLGPTAGAPDEAHRTSATIEFQATKSESCGSTGAPSEASSKRSPRGWRVTSS